MASMEVNTRSSSVKQSIGARWALDGEWLIISKFGKEKGANPIAHAILSFSQLREWDFYPTLQKTRLRLLD